jgi:hypothetical protein
MLRHANYSTTANIYQHVSSDEQFAALRRSRRGSSAPWAEALPRLRHVGLRQAGSGGRRSQTVQREGSTTLFGHGRRPNDLYFVPTFTSHRGKAFRGRRANSTFSHYERLRRATVRKSSSKALERGTGLEPATSTLGSLRQPSTRVDERLQLLPLQSEMSKVVDMGPCQSVGNLWECGIKLRSVAPESPWVWWRLFGLSHAAVAACCSRW